MIRQTNLALLILFVGLLLLASYMVGEAVW